MITQFPKLMIGASKLQKTAMVCFIVGKFMMPATAFSMFFIGKTAGIVSLGIYASLIVACICICLYDRYYHVPFVEQGDIKKLEARLTKLKSQQEIK